MTYDDFRLPVAISFDPGRCTGGRSLPEHVLNLKLSEIRVEKAIDYAENSLFHVIVVLLELVTLASKRERKREGSV